MSDTHPALTRNVGLFAWYKFFHNVVFWQATWFLYFQNQLSAAEALLLYVVYDLTVTVLEVPSGYMSDRFGRRRTLIASAAIYALGLFILGSTGSFVAFAIAQACIGAGAALLSGTGESFLFQSLRALGREKEMEQQSIRVWRYGFIALGLSAVIGGAMAVWWDRLPFLAAGIALLAALICALRFTEPPGEGTPSSETARLHALRTAFANPVLLWLFVLGLLMYGFSHIPFVFGQPFIAETLANVGYSDEAPLVSGTVTAVMMGISLLVSLVSVRLREALGFYPLLLLAFALQILLALGLAWFGSIFAIALLLLRMVPDSISTPFITAHIQPLLQDEMRATFLSIKSLAGRLVFAASLALAAGSTSDIGQMPLADIQSILWVYAVAGVVCLVLLTGAAKRL